MKLKAIVLAIFFYTTLQLYQSIDHSLKVTFCDVGQGDAILIQTPTKKQYLVDGGPDDTVLACIGDRLSIFNRSIDAIFVSHLHADHIIGLIEVMKRYSVNKIIINKIKQNTPEVFEMNKKILERKVNSEQLFEDKKIAFDDQVEGTVYYPSIRSWNTQSGEWQAYLSDLNDSSQLFSLRFNQTMILFTGDCGGKILDTVAQSKTFQFEAKQATNRILKISHHGSSDGISRQLLDTYVPTLAIISVGKDNLFGHPHRQTVVELESRNIPTLRTDQVGTIEISSNGVDTWVKTER